MTPLVTLLPLLLLGALAQEDFDWKYSGKLPHSGAVVPLSPSP